MLDFTGIDHNKAYISHAKKKFGGHFIADDIIELDRHLNGASYNYIVICGVLHHVESRCVSNLMPKLRTYLQPEGKIIIIDHVYLNSNGISLLNKILLKLDRGSFMRGKSDYRDLFKDFTLLSYKQFNIQIGSIVLWSSLNRIVLQKP
jgi:2-polyprenyl-3-methyl-5-hydroxy-6-metoxy-1,4-benzoquinol methylase